MLEKEVECHTCTKQIKLTSSLPFHCWYVLVLKIDSLSFLQNKKSRLKILMIINNDSFPFLLLPNSTATGANYRVSKNKPIRSKMNNDRNNNNNKKNSIFRSFTNLLNSPKDNYKISTSKRKKQNKRIQKNKSQNKAMRII
jgi:hypothetical protein